MSEPPAVPSLIRPQACSRCRYVSATLGKLKCRRYPPHATVIALPKGMMVVSEFPPTQPDHWCGEWQANIEGVH